MFNCKYCGKEIPEGRKVCSRSCNTSYNNIHREMRFSRLVKRHFDLTNNAKELFDGHMLGDGSIPHPSKSIRQNHRFTQLFSQKHSDWAYEVLHDISILGISARSVPYSTFDKRTQKTYDSIQIQTLVYNEFNDIYKKWYKNGKKIVPEDIKLTDNVLRRWYLDDGSLFIKSKNSSRIQFSTDAFSEYDINILVKKLKELGYSPIARESRIFLYRNDEVKRFLFLVGKVPASMSNKGMMGIINNGRLIGLDLDGTLADTNSVELRLIDQNQNTKEREFEYELFYRQIKPIFSVKEFMHEDDLGLIITARNGDDPVISKLTRRWTKKYFPEFALIFAGQNDELKNKGLWKEWQEDIAERKAKIIKEKGVYVYFDDSPSIVEILRDRGVIAMQFGGRI